MSRSHSVDFATKPPSLSSTSFILALPSQVWGPLSLGDSQSGIQFKACFDRWAIGGITNLQVPRFNYSLWCREAMIQTIQRKREKIITPLLLLVCPLLSCLLGTFPMGRIQPEVNWLRNLRNVACRMSPFQCKRDREEWRMELKASG